MFLDTFKDIIHSSLQLAVGFPMIYILCKMLFWSMNVLEYFSCFKDLKGFFKYLQWLKSCLREGKQNGSQRFLEVTNEFVLWKVSVKVLTIFRMSSSPRIADGSCTIDSHKRWIESF